MSCGAGRKRSLIVRSVAIEVKVARGVSVVMAARNVRAAERRNRFRILSILRWKKAVMEKLPRALLRTKCL